MLHQIIQEVMESSSTLDRQAAHVLFLNSHDTIAIGGRSLESATTQFHRVMLSMERHLAKHTQLDIYFAFEVFDFRTLVYLFRIIQQMNRYHTQGKEVHVYWSYVRNEEMIDAGLELKTFCDFPFEIMGLGGFTVNYWSKAS